jgi:hypothetical protein
MLIGDCDSIQSILKALCPLRSLRLPSLNQQDICPFAYIRFPVKRARVELLSFSFFAALRFATLDILIDGNYRDQSYCVGEKARMFLSAYRGMECALFEC